MHTHAYWNSHTLYLQRAVIHRGGGALLDSQAWIGPLFSMQSGGFVLPASPRHTALQSVPDYNQCVWVLWVFKCLHPLISPSPPGNQVADSIGSPRAPHLTASCAAPLSLCGRKTLICVFFCATASLCIVYHRNIEITYFKHILFTRDIFYLVADFFFVWLCSPPEDLHEYNSCNCSSVMPFDWCETECEHFDQEVVPHSFSSVDFRAKISVG